MKERHVLLSSEKQKSITAGGAVLWKTKDNTLYTLLEHRINYDDWTIPKGKQDKGESIFSTAIREIFEETGYEIVLTNFLTEVSYPLKKNKIKKIYYWNSKIITGNFVANTEVDKIKWLPYEIAIKKLTYKSDKKVLKIAKNSFLETQDMELFYFITKENIDNKKNDLKLFAKHFGTTIDKINLITKTEFQEKFRKFDSEEFKKSKIALVFNNSNFNFYKSLNKVF